MQNQFNYSQCTFEARLSKPRVFRRQEFYLYMSKEFLIINQEPYAKKPQIKLQLKPTTHVKWLWQGKNNKRVLKGFVIQTQEYVNQFVAELVVLEMLKSVFSAQIFQSQFYDEYELGQYLDKGNYAQVYSCIKKSDKKKYAVKVMQKQKIKTIKNGRESVFNELKILRALNHKNLLKLFEVFEDRQKYYFVMELLQGITLYKEISSRNKKPETQLKNNQIRIIMKQILSGVAYLADKNIMHRDLKPQNIIFQEKEKIQTGLKIVDYGLATYQHQPTIIFTKCGTPGFVAPQIITYQEKSQKFYDIQVDMFSIGVIFHILLLKQAAFPGKSRNTILNKNKEAKIDFKSKKYDFIASDGIDLLSRLLEKDPTKRISAIQALQHPFLTKQRPIYKFKKSLKQEDETKLISMKMYKNLEEVPADNNQDPSISRIRQTDFQKQFNPFEWPRLNIQKKSNKLNRNLVNSICPIEKDAIYKNVDFFNYYEM